MEHYILLINLVMLIIFIALLYYPQVPQTEIRCFWDMIVDLTSKALFYVWLNDCVD